MDNYYLIKFKKYHKKYKAIFLIIVIEIYSTFKHSKDISLKVCLCVIAKNENLYVREFIDHYKNIGYNKIFLYDNNDKNGEHFEDVINDYIHNGFVKIIDFRERENNSRPIFDAYKDCYSKNNKQYDWLSFYDIDEFLELNKKYETIQDFLSDKLFHKCQNIKINWLMCDNEQSLYYENRPLLQRIKNFNYDNIENKYIKSTVRGNLRVNYWKKLNNPHTSKLKFISCSSSGKLIRYNSPYNDPPEFTNAKLKHFYYKSFEEYCIKIKRGKYDYPNKKRNIIINELYRSLYIANKNNPKKLKIIKKIFNDSIQILT